MSKYLFLDVDGVLNSFQSVVLDQYQHENNKIFNKFMNIAGDIFYKLFVTDKQKWHGRIHAYFKYFTRHYDLCPMACSNLR